LESAAYHIALCLAKCNGKKKSKEDSAKIGIESTIKLINAIEYNQPYYGYTWTKEMR
jgi:hypothetical protein